MSNIFKIKLIFFAQFIFANSIFGQLSWVYFKDKCNVDTTIKLISDKTIAKRKLLNITVFQKSDLPICQSLIDSISRINIVVKGKSKWLNAICVEASEKQLDSIKQFDFVKEIQKSNILIKNNINEFHDPINSEAINQINGAFLDQYSLTGKGVTIGVIDAGFYQADQKDYFNSIFKQNKVVATRDFIEPSFSNLQFYQSHSNVDYHGTNVLKKICGKDSVIKYGLATEADFVLARTDHGNKESRIEELYWINALEWMDSIGVRLVNSSLGYCTGFDNSKENYFTSQMNGNSAISRVAEIAASEKGVFMVISAGNEGNKNNWKIICAPSDAKSVLAVGATYQGLIWQKAGFSSLGTDNIDYIKPNVSCLSNNGTSFSAPMITGLVACLIEKYPTISNDSLLKSIQKGSHLANDPNYYLGYGVPQIDQIINYIEKRELKYNYQIIKTKLHKIKIDVLSQNFIEYHKKNQLQVIDHRMIKQYSKPVYKLKRIKNCNQTTLDFGKKGLITVFWE